MQVARIIYPVEVLGPGKRIGIWVCGCRRHCYHCANPELQAFDSSREIPVSKLIEAIAGILEHYQVDGITISGGEPFEQAAECAELVAFLRTHVPDILVFSGYTLQALQQLDSAEVNSVLQGIAVLVDGEYVEAQNNGSVLRGSDNQIIHILNKDYASLYSDYISGQRQYQNFAMPSGVYGIGLHNPGFLEELQKRMNLNREKQN